MTTPEYSKRGLLAIFFRQINKFVLVFCLVLAGFGTYILLAVPVYSSTGTLLVRFGSDADPDVQENTDKSQQMMMSQNERKEVIQSDADIIGSSESLRTLVREFGYEKIYPRLAENLSPIDSPIETATYKLRKSDVIIKPSQTSDLISVTVFNQNPELSRQMTNRLMDIFIKRQGELYKKPQTAFLENEVKSAADKLAKSQDELQAFKEKTGMTSIDDELQQLLKEKADSRSMALEGISDAEDRIADLQIKERELLNTYREDSPAVQNIRNSIRMAEAQMASRQADLRGGAVDAKNDQTSAKSGDLVSSHIATIDHRIAELESDRETLNNLTRQVSIDEDNYKSFVTREQEARVNEQLQQDKITQITIVDEPVTPVRPSRPRKLVVLAIGLIASGLAALGTIVIAEQMDDRFTDPRGVSAALGIPVLGTFGTHKRTRA